MSTTPNPRNPHGFVVGQKLFKAPTQYSNTRGFGEVTITKIGRDWVTLQCGNRFDIHNLRVDGGNFSSPFSVWLCREDYENTVVLARMWSEFVNSLSHNLPKGMTKEKIEAMKALLAS